MKITHLETAKREINSAIRLLLNGEDIIAIHTIIAATHEVTYSICKRKEIKSFMKDICIKYIKKGFHKNTLKPWIKQEIF